MAVAVMVATPSIRCSSGSPREVEVVVADVVAGVPGVGEVRVADPGRPVDGRRVLGGRRILGRVARVSRVVGSVGVGDRTVLGGLGPAGHHEAGDQAATAASTPTAISQRRFGGGDPSGPVSAPTPASAIATGFVCRRRRAGGNGCRGHGRRGARRGRRVAGVVHVPPRMAQRATPPIAGRGSGRSPRPPSRRDRLAPTPTGGTRHECPAQARGTRSAFVRPLGVVTVAQL